MKEDLKGFLPLSSASFYILLALSDEDRHGYGIMRRLPASQKAGTASVPPPSTTIWKY